MVLAPTIYGAAFYCSISLCSSFDTQKVLQHLWLFFRASLSSSCSGGRLSSQGHSDGEGRPPQRLYAKRDTRRGDSKRESKRTHQGGIKPASHFNERRKSIGQPGSRQPSLRYLTPKVKSISRFHFTYKNCIWSQPVAFPLLSVFKFCLSKTWQYE